MPGQTEPTFHWPIPEYDDYADAPKAFQDLGNGVDASLTAVQSGTVMRFATKAARDAALVGALAPVPGMFAYCGDIKRTEMFITPTAATFGAFSGWAPLPGTFVASFYRGTAQPIPNNVGTYMAWDQVNFDLLGGYSAATPSRYTFKVPGAYIISGGVSFTTHSSVTLRQAYFYINGAPAWGNAIALGSVIGFDTVLPLITSKVALKVNDYIEVGALQLSGVQLNTSTSSGAVWPSLHVVYAGAW